jgi:hypothetical protein
VEGAARGARPPGGTGSRGRRAAGRSARHPGSPHRTGRGRARTARHRGGRPGRDGPFRCRDPSPTSRRGWTTVPGGGAWCVSAGPFSWSTPTRNRHRSRGSG